MKRFARALLQARTSVQAMATLLLVLWLALMCVVFFRFSLVSNDLAPEFRMLNKLEVAEQSQIDVGIHFESINDFDPVKNTFKAEGTIWTKWYAGDMPDAESSPLESLYFSNSIDSSSGIDTESSEGIIDLGNGQSYEYAEFSGYFKNNPIDYRGYPFNPIKLSIRVESDDYGIDKMIIKPEVESSDFSESIEILGYKPKRLIPQQLVREYSTSWGLRNDGLDGNIEVNSDVEEYSIAEFNFELTRSTWIGIRRQVVPVFVVIAVAIMSFTLPAQLAARVSTPPGLLLALVFLQGQQYGDIPASIEGWTYIGKLTACGYLILFLSFVDALRANQLKNERDIQAFECASRKQGIFLTTLVFLVSLL